MAHLSLSFLGGFNVTHDTAAVTNFSADKVRALLAYLAINSEQAHHRSELAAMFWPDYPEKKAAHSLSQGLLRLRTALREKEAISPAPFLLVTPQTVQFNANSSYQLDVAQFRELLRQCEQHQHTPAANCPICEQWLTQAVALYRGDLLSGLFLPDSLAFEEWRIVQQEELHRMVMNALSQLAAYHEERGEWEQVENDTRRLIALEPWHEEAQAKLLHALVHRGQTAAALEQFERYQQILADELDIQPPEEIVAFVQQIRAGSVAISRTAAGAPVKGEGVWFSNQGERRQVTALICRHPGGGPADLETFQEQMARCERQCEAVFHRFGGHRAQRQGGTCLVYFGYPQAYEDATRRAVYSALAVTRAVDQREPVQIAIHTDLILVGEKRGQRWQDRDLLGSVVDVARDCLRLSGPGEVIITGATQQLLQDAFEVTALKDQMLIGPDAPQMAYQVLGESKLQNRLEWLAHTQRLTTYTGRVAELKQAQRGFETLLRGKGLVIFLRGEPGIGKSRFVWELQNHFTRSTSGDPNTTALWLYGRCLPYDQNTSLYPLIGLLEDYLCFAPDDSVITRREKLTRTLARFHLDRPSAIWLLSLLLGMPTGEDALEAAPPAVTEAQRNQMGELVLTLLQKQAMLRPLVLVIEDLHWSDPSTVDWLGKSLAALATVPCLTLLTARPGFRPSWSENHHSQRHLLVLNLPPLSAEQMANMVSDLAGDRNLPEDLRQRIVTQADGNPLFVEELTKTLLELPAQSSASNTGMDIPATLHDSLAARLDHLGAARETAQWASVLGREFSYPILQACTPYDEQRLQNDLARLIEAELMSPVQSTPQAAAVKNSLSARYTFKHTLVQEAAYHSLLKRTRQVYHRRVAEALESRFPQVIEKRPELLAQHYASADMPSQAASYWLHAGELATAQGATLEARTFYNQAFEASDPAAPEQRWQILEGRMKVFDLRGEREAQKGDIDGLFNLAERLNDDARRAQAYLHLKDYASRRNDNLLILSASEDAIAASQRAGNLVLEVKGWVGKVQALTLIESWEAGRQAVEETLAKLPRITDDGVRAFALGSLAFYYIRTGDLVKALAFMESAAEAARRLGDRRMESHFDVNISFTYTRLGSYDRARAAIENGQAQAEAIGDWALENNHRINLSYVAWCESKLDEARALGEQALHRCRTNVSSPVGKAFCLTYLGFYLEQAGELTQAISYLEEASADFTRMGMDSYSQEPQAVKARCLLAMGRVDEARDAATAVWNWLRQHGTEGIDFPARVYVCVADVIDQAGAPGVSAGEVTKAGYQDLMQQAERISNAACRRSFLEKAAENREIVQKATASML